jgi:hypothetical protein
MPYFYVKSSFVKKIKTNDFCFGTRIRAGGIWTAPGNCHILLIPGHAVLLKLQLKAEIQKA